MNNDRTWKWEALVFHGVLRQCTALFDNFGMNRKILLEMKYLDDKPDDQSKPYDFYAGGPPVGLWSDVGGSTAEHINQITLEGTEQIEFGKFRSRLKYTWTNSVVKFSTKLLVPSCVFGR